MKRKSSNDGRAVQTGAQPPPQGVESTLPTIEHEPVEEPIRVGAGGPMIVPREDIGADIDEGTELDLAGLLPLKIRKPGRREWIALNPGLVYPTRLLVHKSNPKDFDEEYYYVEDQLRGPIHDELKAVHIVVFYSFSMKENVLWIRKVTPGERWYESLVPLFQHPPEFFKENAIRIRSDMSRKQYRVSTKPVPGPVTWPSKTTGVLLGEKLGASGFITSPDHPLYRDLTEGTELK